MGSLLGGLQNKIIKLKVPTTISLPRKTMPDRKISLNLNTYRNLHYQVNNQVKKLFAEEIKDLLKDVKIEGKIRLTYFLHMGTNRKKVDRNNILCIVDKYFCDALVENGCIEDDSDEYIESTHNYTGEVSKGNPYVEVIIEEL